MCIRDRFFLILVKGKGGFPMKKSVIVNFFKWWFSIHPSNIAVSEDWLNLEKRLKEKKEVNHVPFI